MIANQKLIEKCIKYTNELEKDNPVRDVDIQKASEDYRNDQFLATFRLLKDLNEIETKAAKKMYNYKKTQELENEHMSRQVVFQYKSGICDPNRPTALFEKQDHIKMTALNANKTKVKMPERKTVDTQKKG